MGLLTPDPGLLFWMLVTFGAVFFLLAKFGFPVILRSVEERKAYIEESLRSAQEAAGRLAGVQAEADRLLAEARAEQARILAQAAATRDRIIKEAQQKAYAESDRLLAELKKQLATEKESALRDIRRQVALLSVEVAEKVLRSKLAGGQEQAALIDRLLDEVSESSHQASM